MNSDTKPQFVFVFIRVHLSLTYGLVPDTGLKLRVSSAELRGPASRQPEPDAPFWGARVRCRQAIRLRAVSRSPLDRCWRPHIAALLAATRHVDHWIRR